MRPWFAAALISVLVVPLQARAQVPAAGRASSVKPAALGPNAPPMRPKERPPTRVVDSRPPRLTLVPGFAVRVPFQWGAAFARLEAWWPRVLHLRAEVGGGVHSSKPVESGALHLQATLGARLWYRQTAQRSRHRTRYLAQSGPVVGATYEYVSLEIPTYSYVLVEGGVQRERLTYCANNGEPVPLCDRKESNLQRDILWYRSGARYVKHFAAKLDNGERHYRRFDFALHLLFAPQGTPVGNLVWGGALNQGRKVDRRRVGVEFAASYVTWYAKNISLEFALALLPTDHLLQTTIGFGVPLHVY